MPSIILINDEAKEQTLTDVNKIVVRDVDGGTTEFVDSVGGSLIGYKMTKVTVTDGVAVLPKGMTVDNLFYSGGVPVKKFSVIRILHPRGYCIYNEFGHEGLPFLNQGGKLYYGGGATSITGAECTVDTSGEQIKVIFDKVCPGSGTYPGNVWYGYLYLYELIENE